MAEKVEIAASLKLDSEQANQSVKSFKQQLKEANQELFSVSEKFGESSIQAINAAKRVAELRDTIGDTKSLVDAFNPDRKFQAFQNTISGVAGGFSALQGVMALVGAESEDVQKSLLKVQAALAISQGVNNILELKDTFKQLGTFIQSTTIFQKANNAATQAAAGIQKLFGIEVKATSTSFQVLKGAIAATGIGLLVVAIGEVVSALQQWSQAAEDAAERQKQLSEETKKFADIGLSAEQDFLNREEKLQVARAKARGASELELFNIQKQFQQSRISSQKRHYAEVNVVDEAAGEQSKRQIKNLQVDLELQRLNYEAEQQKKREEAEKKRQEKAKQDAEKRKQELKEALERERAGEQELAKLRESNNILEIQNEREREREKIIAQAEGEKRRIEELKISASLREKLLYEIRRNERDQLIAFDLETEEQQKAKDAARLENGLNTVMALLKQNQDIVAAQNELRTELADQQKSDLELQLQELDAWYKKKIEIAGTNEALQTQLTESYERQRTALVKSNALQRLDIVAGILGKASELFGKQTAVGKTLAIAEATINTYAGATAALRSKVPFPEPIATGIRIAQAALIIATGLKSIKEIAKAKVPGATGGDVSTSIPSVSASAPLTATPQVSTTQLDQDTINNIGNAASSVRAFVVESDVTDNQEKITRLNRAARLGG